MTFIKIKHVSDKMNEEPICKNIFCKRAQHTKSLLGVCRRVPQLLGGHTAMASHWTPYPLEKSFIGKLKPIEQKQVQDKQAAYPTQKLLSPSQDPLKWHFFKGC